MNKLSTILADTESSILAPGIYDALSAKLAEIYGFKVAWVSGFSVCTSLFLEDNNSLSYKKYIERISEIREVSNIPLIVDCDEGFGDIDKTILLFKHLNELKIECCCIEDNVYPKLNSFNETKSHNRAIKNIEYFSKNISVLKNSFPDTILIARTESLIIGEDLDMAIKRAYAYRKAGADLVVIHSKSKTYKEFELIAKKYNEPKTLVVIPTLAENLSAKDFNQMGYKIIIYANQILRNSINNINEILQLMSESASSKSINNNSVSMEYIFKLIEKYPKHNINKPK